MTKARLSYEGMESVPQNISFRRDLIDSKLVATNDLMAHLNNITLSEGRDGFRWSVNQFGKFSVNSLVQGAEPNQKSQLWKLKFSFGIYTNEFY